MEFKEKDKLLLLYEETTNLIPESNKISKEKIDKVESTLSSIASDVSSKLNVTTTLEFGEPINTIGGAIVQTKNGDIEVNNTIEFRKKKKKKSLRSDVAQILFK